ncbi:hypothetical protein EW026_g5597 [Hermanssonia centrifuga]|uniref:Uncharacterized protein n=1 Tax=Hermanssonia centrifuga TaxID=98765 RepID=A0A4S4KDW2_9APHY|nr:hypothetical protein EW026_g5597 [Hermanssonia centrifuga]
MPQNDDAQRPARPRANTTFNAFNWRRGKIPTSVETAAPSAELTQPLPLETLIEALTPPAVPSLAYARALAHTLSTVTPPPRFAILSPVLANLCGANAPIAFQAAGYDILASYWENCGSAVLTTADRLSCFSLFLDLSVSWLTELWEPRFKALVALIRSGTETVGIEAQLLKILRTWIEGAFSGLTVPDPSISPSPAHTEERLERQRAVESMTALLMSLVGRAEFVSRISETDTSTVLQLFGNLIDKITLVSPISTSRIPMRHHRHQSSLSIPQVPAVKPAADLAVEIYLNYLAIRLKAVAPVHLKTILPHLFRALAFYASPLPRLSLTPSDIHENPLEMRIMEVLDSLVTGPYSASCTVMLKYHLFPEEKGVQEAARTSLGAIRTLRASIRRVLIVHLARQIVIERDLLERAWAKDDAATWDLNRFRSVLCRAVRQWIEFDQTGSAMCSTANHPCEMILTEITGILKDITQAFDETGDELDYEEVEAIGDILRELTAFVRLQKTPGGAPIRIALSQMEVPTNFLSMLSALLAQDLLVTPLHSVLPTVILSIAEHVSDTDTAQLLCAMLERQSFSPTSPMWLDNWKTVLAIPDLFSIHRARTRQVAVDILLSVWEFVKDIAAYRHPLATLVFGFWREQAVDLKEDHTSIIIWRILGDEIVLHSVERLEETTTESDEEDPVDIAGQIVDFLTLIASESHDDELEVTGDTTLPSPSLHMPSTMGSPILSRMTSEYPPPIKEKETTIPSVMSLLSSLTSGHSSRSHSQPPHSHDQPTAPESPMAHPPEQPSIPKAVALL